MDTSLWILWKDIPKISVSHSVVSDSLRPHGLQPTRLLCPWNSPVKNTGVSSHSLLQGIFPIQGSNLRLPHCRQILYCLSCQGSPDIRCCCPEKELRKEEVSLYSSPLKKNLSSLGQTHLPEMTPPISASDAYTGHPTNRPVFVFKKKFNIDIIIIPDA